jgi:hypothetical protein
MRARGGSVQQENYDSPPFWSQSATGIHLVNPVLLRTLFRMISNRLRPFVLLIMILSAVPLMSPPVAATDFSVDYENSRRIYFRDYWLAAAGLLDPNLNITIVIEAGEGIYEISHIEKVVPSERFLFVTFRSQRGGGTYHALVDPINILLITERPTD